MLEQGFSVRKKGHNKNGMWEGIGIGDISLYSLFLKCVYAYVYAFISYLLLITIYAKI